MDNFFTPPNPAGASTGNHPSAMTASPYSQQPEERWFALFVDETKIDHQVQNVSRVPEKSPAPYNVSREQFSCIESISKSAPYCMDFANSFEEQKLRLKWFFGNPSDGDDLLCMYRLYGGDAFQMSARLQPEWISYFTKFLAYRERLMDMTDILCSSYGIIIKDHLGMMIRCRDLDHATWGQKTCTSNGKKSDGKKNICGLTIYVVQRLYERRFFENRVPGMEPAIPGMRASRTNFSKPYCYLALGMVEARWSLRRIQKFINETLNETHGIMRPAPVMPQHLLQGPAVEPERGEAEQPQLQDGVPKKRGRGRPKGRKNNPKPAAAPDVNKPSHARKKKTAREMAAEVPPIAAPPMKRQKGYRDHAARFAATQTKPTSASEMETQNGDADHAARNTAAIAATQNSLLLTPIVATKKRRADSGSTAFKTPPKTPPSPDQT